ncbi:MAG: ABC transporter ATP-binding protein [Ruminococcaceae bacterium]|nr:ABC transporter ATP-binding protein [Oscillospiraceae bacterium]
MMENQLLINKKLTDKQLSSLIALGTQDEPILFAIVGEINEKAQYAPCVLLATHSHLFTYDLNEKKLSEKYAFCDIEKIYVKRMYGNGVMRLSLKNGDTVDFFRFTFTVTALCDAVVTFVKDVKNDVPISEAYEIMSAVYDKLLSVCPKCGRALSAPGVPCVHCMDKMRLIKKLGGYLKPEIPIIIITIIMTLVTTACNLIPPLLTKSLVDDILPNSDRNALVYVVILLICVYIVHYTLFGIRSYMLRSSGNKVIARLRKDVYEKAQFLPMRFYDKTSTGSVINRISSDTSTIQTFMLRITYDVIVQLFRLVSPVIIMLAINPRLTLLSLAPIPIIVIGSRIFRKKIAPFYRRIWRRSSAVTSVLADTIPGIRVVKSFANEKNASEKFSYCVEKWRITDTKAGKILSAYPSIITCLVQLGGIVIWALGGNMVIDQLSLGSGATVTIGLLVSFISYATMFYGPVEFFANFSDTMQHAMASIERIMDILDAEPEHDFGKGNVDANIGGKIEFINVNFSFDRTKKTLKNINLTIEPGEIVGIVGTTGSGKSTLINLLLRYYDHYEGQITVGGVDIRDIDMQYYRSSIGYVQQEPQMFHDTIYNNIAYGNDNFSVDEVINAADIANAHEFIVRQPDGYDSVLGERGVGLSGGERQRISIARAMLRDPKMLVFDEATASVDSETEHLIQEAIEHLISGRTTIMIAHRLSTLSKATKIVVIDNGEIIECGSPEELMAKKGKYYRLVEIQSMSDKIAESKRAEKFE